MKGPTRGRNPVGPSKNEIAAAKALFKDFRGHEPGQATPVNLRAPKTGLVVGELDGVLYTTERDGKKEAYIHKFKKKARPLLVSGSDGQSLHIVGGRYAFTERGIVDDE